MEKKKNQFCVEYILLIFIIIRFEENTWEVSNFEKSSLKHWKLVKNCNINFIN